jgi:ubiquinone/menaquinone biosynthesis C-methylase UbiE
MVWGFDVADGGLERTVVDCLPDDFRGRALDVPVGTGLFTKEKYAKMQDAEIVGLDCSQGMLDRAAEAYGAAGAKVRLLRGDAAALPFADGYFDAVLTMNGLPCFPDKEKPLREMLRVLKTGGELFGCSYVKGARAFSDFVLGTVYPKLGYTTPPYQTEAELTACLKSRFASVRVWRMGALMGFACAGKKG